MAVQFLDEARIFIKSGNGGDGVVAFRREKYVPHGGPSGGDGGRGGDVIFLANPKINTLRNFANQVHYRAEHGNRGGSGNKTGADALDLVIEVPVGTLIRDAEGRLLADLTRPEQRVVVLKGGRGGRGNTRFKSSTNQAPRMAEKGEPGQELWVNLELKLMADVGIVGVPNAGKSTLLSVVSNAKPRIANYPFTTLAPNLGVVYMGYEEMVVADIPGLVEGAHQGVGLGHDFLRHVQRTRVLIHLLDGTAPDPLADFHQINTELALFDERLLARPMVVAVNKMDMPDAQVAWPDIQATLTQLGYEVTSISGITHQNVDALMKRVYELLQTVKDQEPITFEDIVPEEEMPTYEMQPDDSFFTVERVSEGIFQVNGKRIERAAAMTYWDYDHALNRFQRILEAMGISKALEEAGVQSGDTVFIGDLELEWSTEFEEE